MTPRGDGHSCVVSRLWFWPLVLYKLMKGQKSAASLPKKCLPCALRSGDSVILMQDRRSLLLKKPCVWSQCRVHRHVPCMVIRQFSSTAKGLHMRGRLPGYKNPARATAERVGRRDSTLQQRVRRMGAALLSPRLPAVADLPGGLLPAARVVVAKEPLEEALSIIHASHKMLHTSPTT